MIVTQDIEQVVGEMHGLPVITDPNLPTNMSPNLMATHRSESPRRQEGAIAMNELVCYICILHESSSPNPGPGAASEAVTMVAGTAVCAQHISHIANHQVLSAIGITALPTTTG